MNMFAMMIKKINKLISGVQMRRIKKWLDDNERNASYLARKCDVSPAAVKYWLDGKTTPSYKHRRKLFEITGVNV